MIRKTLLGLKKRRADKMNKSYWIWNRGDYEIFHANEVNSRRRECGADYPCFWRIYGVDHNVRFYREFTAECDDTLELYVNGKGYLMIDTEMYAANVPIKLSKGKHNLTICVNNLRGLPAAYLKSAACPTDGSWHTVNEYGRDVSAGYNEYYTAPDANPEIFPFEYKRIYPVSKEETDGGILFDFGRELFGYLILDNIRPEEKVHVSYGESREEAVDTGHSLLYEDVCGAESRRLRQSAFRYIFVTGAKTAEVSADFEYLPLEKKGSFECDDEAVNKIWDMCAYTLGLTSREVQLEAIKRDRWLWGGDAYQAYKFNNYLFFDKEIIKRSTIALRGKEPFCEHINSITDYSFLWVIGLWEYYMNYGDVEFIKFIYPRAVSLMNFSAKRVNDDGFIIGKPGDWIFVDWSDIDKEGAVCAEQILWIAANRTMARLAEILGEDSGEYSRAADEMLKKTNEYFWDAEKGAYIDGYQSGKRQVTRHANIFAVMYGIAGEDRKKSIIENVLLNDEITPITTPYFEGYELDVFGLTGNFDFIENKIKTYWRGMLDLGATTVWEEFNPELSGAEHYAMYGKKYGKSLCHAWGAAPIYLLGRYFLGVSPEKAGFEAFTVKPYLGGFEYIKGTVPIKDGEVRVYLSKEKLSVTATRDGGTLVWRNERHTLKANEEIILSV